MRGRSTHAPPLGAGPAPPRRYGEPLVFHLFPVVQRQLEAVRPGRPRRSC